MTWREVWEHEGLSLSNCDEHIAWFLNKLGKGQKHDIFQMVLGAGPAFCQVMCMAEQQSKVEEDEAEEKKMEGMMMTRTKA